MSNKTALFIFCMLVLTQLVVLSSTYPLTILEEDDLKSETMNNLTPKTAETDLERVKYRLDHFPNRGFEHWKNQYEPQYLSTSRSREIHTWYAESPEPVNEGSKSLGLETRATDEYHPVEARFSLRNQPSLPGPINLTLSFDWWIDALSSPVDTDYFRVEIKMAIEIYYEREIYYYLGTQTSLTNSSTRKHIMIDGSYQIWNKFSCNLTSEFIDLFGDVPSHFQTMYFRLTSSTHSYSRAFLDDVNLINGTDYIIGGPQNENGGDFEVPGDWSFSNYDPAYISRSTVRHEGNWSLNTTVVSDEYPASGSFYANINKRLTDLNQDQFNFWWRIDDWQNASTDTYSSLYIQCQNDTDEFYIYYILCHGGDTAPQLAGSEGIQLLAEGFNTTGEWTFFNISIWDIITSYNHTEDLFVGEIEIEIRATEANSRLTMLVDNMTFVSSGLSAMSYEDQLDIGSPVHDWGYMVDETTDFTVTDFARTGNKAANLTLTGNSDFYGEYFTGYQPFNVNTELILDLNYYIHEFNDTADHFLWLEIGLDDNNFGYLIANGSTFTEFGETGGDYIILQDTNTVGSWINLQLDLVHGYESVFGSAPNTSLDYINLRANSDVQDNTLMIYFDDFYLYEDPTPDVTNVTQSTSFPEAEESVTVSAKVIDATLNSTQLHYRVDSGPWTNLSMARSTGDIYQATIPSPSWQALVEYYVNATDAFGKSTIALNGSSYFSFSAIDTIDPSIVFVTPNNQSTVNETVDIQISAADSGSGIASVNISIDGVSVLNETSAQFTIYWDTTAVENGLHAILAIVHDAAGNSAQSTLVITVDNAGPEPDILTIVLVVTVIGAGGATVVVVIIIRRRD